MRAKPAPGVDRHWVYSRRLGPARRDRLAHRRCLIGGSGMASVGTSSVRVVLSRVFERRRSTSVVLAVGMLAASLAAAVVTGRASASAEPAASAHPLNAVSASVDGGDAHTCAVQTTRLVACWGKNDLGQATPPAGTFADVSSGGSFTCGVRTDATMACWGKNTSGQATAPSGAFRQLSAGAAHACGVLTD